MRIVYVITRSDVMGGASVHLLDLARGMKSLGHEVTVLVGGQGIVVDRAEQFGLECLPLRYMVREISPLVDLKGYFELRKKLAELKPEVVHLHSAKAGILGRLAARSISVPAIYTAHGWPFTEGVSEKKRKFYAFIERAMAKLSARIITVSEYDRDIAIESKVADGDQLVVVHNGIPDVPVNSRSPEPEPDRIKLVMVARFEEPKNQRALIEALASVVDLDWTLEFIGDGPNLESVMELVEALGLSERVMFLGSRDDVPACLGAADALVLVSRWEGLPLTVLEAMRAGLPVIASDVGGVGEAVGHGVTGFLVPRDSKPALIESLRRVISDPAIRESMGKAGRQRFEAEFTFDGMLHRTLAVYHHVIGARG
ncbi:glycosyltransferase family 4 protein [Marinobacter shengliensis]|uniref:glycosyltransferase family 4 protein n=1 Tax=Marinobacter shengliensis TaxID=1389223 RepID=UPI001BB13961|nr:glycosyltransferase family 4 protein [Marinobacter shengliensis]